MTYRGLSFTANRRDALLLINSQAHFLCVSSIAFRLSNQLLRSRQCSVLSYAWLKSVKFVLMEIRALQNSFGAAAAIYRKSKPLTHPRTHRIRKQ